LSPKEEGDLAQFYLGQIIQGGWNFAPNGSAMCNGQTLAITQNTALFSLLGTTYGGNGVSTFQLPDLQGRTMIHQGNGSGLSPYVLGEKSGSENAALTISNLPSHTHPMTSSLSASGLQPHATELAPAAGSVLGHGVDISGNASLAQPAIYCPAGTATPIALGGLNVSAGLTGGSLPFSVVSPFNVVTMCIVLQGILPSRN
jgi:microcystin-dependent protein